MSVFKATKKPVTVEVIRFIETGRINCRNAVAIEHNGRDVARFIGKPTNFPTIPDGTPQGKIVAVIETLEGKMHADLGDYIIKGVNGEFYPCKPDIFEKTYDF